MKWHPRCNEPEWSFKRNSLEVLQSDTSEYAKLNHIFASHRIGCGETQDFIFFIII